MTYIKEPAQLKARGYRPVPVKGKAALPAGWTSYEYKAGDVFPSIGILCGEVCGFDIDIRDSGAQAVVFSAWRDAMPDFHAKLTSAPHRIGQAPKTLIPLRYSRPVPKQSRAFYAPGDDKPHKVEALGVGQQFVAYGIHPDTHKPYTWNGGGELLNINIADLPVVTPEEVAQALEVAAEALEMCGWSLTRERTDGTPSDGSITRWPHGEYRPVVCDGVPGSVLDALGHIDAEDYDSWIATGQALKAEERNGATWAFDAWVAWSKGSSKWQEHDEDRWSGFLGERTNLSRIMQVAQITPFKAVDDADYMEEDLDDTDYKPVLHLVEDLVPLNGDTMIWGKSGEKKSFLALDIALHVRYGRPWHGRKVRKGRVLYLAGEGLAGIQKRVIAWRKHHGVREHAGKDGMFRINKADKIVPLDGSYSPRLRSSYDLIVIDTLNRWSQGDENKAEEMGLWLKNVRALAVACGNATVIIVHHARKDGGEYRGSTALKAAMDAEFEVAASKDIVTLTHNKAKDDQLCEPMQFKANVVHLGMRDDGFGGTKAHTSLVLTLATEGEVASVQTADERAIFQAIMNGATKKTDIAVKAKGNKKKMLDLIDHMYGRNMLVKEGPNYSIAPGFGVFEKVPEAGTSSGTGN